MIKKILFICICAHTAFGLDYTQPEVKKLPSVSGTPLSIKNDSSIIYGVYASNKSQCPRYLKLFNKKASSVVLGIDKPDLTYVLRPQTNNWFPNINEQSFSEGISVVCTKHDDPLDTKGVPVNECLSTFLYK